MGVRGSDGHAARRRALLGDVAVVVALAVVAVAPWLTGDRAPGGWSVVPLLSCLVLLARRHRPVEVLVVSAVLALAGTILAEDGVLLVPLAVAVLTAAAAGRRRAAALGAVATGLALEAVLFLRGEELSSTVVVSVPLLLALAVAGGTVVDGRRRELAGLGERARRAEETREAQARQAVAEERLRIARDLHDVLAHQVAVVGVQAGVAEHLLEVDPGAARTALVHVRTAGASALRELATLLDLLRQDGDDPTRPAPSLTRLDELVEDARATGLTVRVATTGETRAVAPVVDSAAYRVVQESLTNAHKHGTGTAAVRVEYASAAVRLEVTNPCQEGTADPGRTGGHGLVGLRERVAAVGGTVRTTAGSGTWTVEVELPAPTLPGDGTGGPTPSEVRS